MGEKPPLGRWKECRQLVEGEADGDRESGLERTGRGILV
jgi:hypothetical protein